MQDATPVKDKGEGQQDLLEKEQQQQQGKVEMTPVRRAELEPSPQGTPEQPRAEEVEAASPGFDPKTPERPPTK